MLIDYFDRLPHLVVWLDWNFYAYKLSLIVCIILMNAHYIYRTLSFPHPYFHTGGFITAAFVGFCLWCVYIALSPTQGYGVG